MTASIVMHRRRQGRDLKFLVLLCLFMIVSVSWTLYGSDDWQGRAQREQLQLRAPETLQRGNKTRHLSKNNRLQAPPVTIREKKASPRKTTRAAPVYGGIRGLYEQQEQRRSAPENSTVVHGQPRIQPGIIIGKKVQRRKRKVQPITLHQCIFDLVVTLRTSPPDLESNLTVAPGADIDECIGFLIRDDLVLTSRECATVATSVHVVGYEERTIDYVIEMESSEERPLALMKLELPPYKLNGGPEYHKNSGWPRHRMFLNKSKDTETNPVTIESNWSFSFTNHHDGVLFRVACNDEKRRPTLSAYQRRISAKLIPIPLVATDAFGDSDFYTEMRDMLIHEESIPIKSTDSKNESSAYAEMSNDKGERWWVKKQNTTIMSEIALGWVRKHSQSPPDANALTIGNGLGIGGVLKLEDPQGGRKLNCLEDYFAVWADEQPFSCEPFFQWLDYGSGRDLDHILCSRRILNEKRMHYFNDTDRRNSRIEWTRGDDKNMRINFAESGMPLTNGTWPFVWGLDKQLYAARENRDIVGHCSFFAGGPVLFAGEVDVCGDNGHVLGINSQSGHYRPKRQHTQAFIRHLKDMNVFSGTVELDSNSTASFETYSVIYISFQHIGNQSDSCLQPNNTKTEQPRKGRRSHRGRREATQIPAR